MSDQARLQQEAGLAQWAKDASEDYALEVPSKAVIREVADGRLRLLQSSTDNGCNRAIIMRRLLSHGRLVAKKHQPLPPQGADAVLHHKDSDPLNDCAENLEWVTQA